MSVNWRNTTLGDELTFQRGFDITKKEQIPGLNMVFSSSGPNSTHTEYKVEGPGVIIGRKGSLGTVFFSKDNYWPHDTTLWIKDFHGNNPKFAFYFLQGLHLEQYDSGASNPSLNRNHIHLLPILYPSNSLQRKIAGILSAYDDLIENNTRRIKILEEMARRIYKEWFVDFKYPGHKNDKLVNSELGMIPEGWEVKKIGDVFDIKYGKGLPTKNLLITGAYPVYGAGGVIGYYNELVYDKKVTLITCRGNGSGTVWRTREPAYITNNSFLIIPKQKYPHFEYHYIEQLCLNSNVKSVISGSAQPQITITGLSTVDCLIPIKYVIENYCERTGLLSDSIDFLFRKNTNLRQTRDLLLPKLISGKVDVSELDIGVIN